MPVLVQLHKEGPISNVHEGIVDAQCVLVIVAERGEVLIIDLRNVGDVKDWGSMNKVFEHFTCAIEHAIGIWVIGHLDLDVFGWHSLAVGINDVKGDILGSIVHLESVWNGGSGVWSCLDAN